MFDRHDATFSRYSTCGLLARHWKKLLGRAIVPFRRLTMSQVVFPISSRKPKWKGRRVSTIVCYARLPWQTQLNLCNHSRDNGSVCFFAPAEEMIGTTRSRVSFFMNKFRKLGFIHYNGGGLEVHSHC